MSSQRSNFDAREPNPAEARESLRTMDGRCCTHFHHFVWRHGGQDLPPCPDKVRQRRSRCAHNFEQPRIREALDVAERCGLLTREQRTDLWLMVHDASDSLFTNFDSRIYGLVRLWEVKDEQISPELKQYRATMAAPHRLEDLQPSYIEAESIRLQHLEGQPIERVRRLLMALLGLADREDGKACTQAITARFLEAQGRQQRANVEPPLPMY